MIDNEAKENILKILKAISSGIDPLTGECFDRSVLSSDHDISHAIRLLAMTTQKQSRIQKTNSKNLLNRPAEKIFNDLREWRIEQSIGSHLPAYCIFSDKELWSIANGDVCKKEDLLAIKGISYIRYDRYGDDIMKILSKYIEHSELAESCSITTSKKEQKLVTTESKTPAVSSNYHSAKSSANTLPGSIINTCENCMEKKNGDCFGAKNVCEFFRPSPTNIEGKDNWPKYGDATYFRLTRGKK